MRYLSPEIDAVIELFDRCYERRPNGSAAPSWQLVALPEQGSIAEQDAWTMRALAFMRDVGNRLELDLAAESQKGRARLVETYGS